MEGMQATDLARTALEAASAAASQGNYEAVYHFLMGALHVADRRGDLELVGQLSRLAQSYRVEIDALRPEHHLSTAAAARRGQTGLFEGLQIHARAVALRHRANAG